MEGKEVHHIALSNIFGRKKGIVVYMLTITLSVLLLFLVANYVINRHSITGIIEHNYMQIANKQLEIIEEWMESRIEHIEKFAQHQAMVAAVNYSNALGKMSPNEQARLKTHISTIIKDEGVYNGFAVLDRQGQLCFISDPRLEKPSQEMFSKIKYITDTAVFPALITGEDSSVTISQPVASPTYEWQGDKEIVIGFLVGYINMAILDDSLSLIDLGKGGYAYIVDKAGRVLVSSGDFESKISGKTDGGGKTQETDQGKDLKSTEAGYILLDSSTGKLIASVDKCIKTGRTVIDQYTSHLGTPVIGLCKWFSYLEWAFLVEVDRGYAYASMTRIVGFYLVSALVFIIATLLASYFAFGKMMNPIKRIINTIKELSTGNLGVRTGIDAGSEIGDIGESLDGVLEKVSSVMKNVKENSMQLASASEEMSASALNYTDNAQKQAASAEEIMSTVEELYSGMENVSEGANDQYESLKVLDEKMHELSESINFMGSMIKDALNLTHGISGKAKSGGEYLTVMNQSMKRIDDSTKEMTNIIEIINNISGQVNLLALNAAIEAARAGEAGRGFAVVADEIAKLADQTAGSLKDIDSLIRVSNDEIRIGTENVSTAVNVITDIIAGVESISNMMNLIYQNMEKQLVTNENVNREAEKVKNRSNEIRTATEEQKVAAEEIVKSVSYINELSQIHATTSEEAAANSEVISGIASDLTQRVDFFKM